MPASPDRPLLALVGGAVTRVVTFEGEDLREIASIDRTLRGFSRLADGRLLLVDETGALESSGAAELAKAGWSPGAPTLGAAGDPAAITPVDDLRGGLVALRLDNERSTSVIRLDADGRNPRAVLLGDALEGLAAPLPDGRLVVVRRNRHDAPRASVLDGEDLRDTAVSAYDVAITGDTAVLLTMVTTLSVQPTVDLLDGRAGAVPLPGIPGAVVDRFALDGAGGRLLVTWRDEEDRLRWVTVLGRSVDGAWEVARTVELPPGLARVLPAWAP